MEKEVPDVVARGLFAKDLPVHEERQLRQGPDHLIEISEEAGRTDQAGILQRIGEIVELEDAAKGIRVCGRAREHKGHEGKPARRRGCCHGRFPVRT